MRSRLDGRSARGSAEASAAADAHLRGTALTGPSSARAGSHRRTLDFGDGDAPVAQAIAAL
ncbi:hypothetical protein [Luteimonas abyssi]|uniref:hypothetical protein n=1 Tax=Luteimonas abyssi TaxID=1247514 RepID=UPI000737ACB5|nr:hypothetical protein [Luteimonas abyssi]